MRKIKKLWQKVSLISVVVMVMVVTVCSSVLLNYTKKNILDKERVQIIAKQEALTVSFTQMVSYYLADEADPTVKESGIKYCFSEFADETAVLTDKNRILFSAVSIDPTEILPLNYDYVSNLSPIDESFTDIYYVTTAYTKTTINGRNIIVAGNVIVLKNEFYSIYIVKDITETYNEITELTWWFSLISLICVAVGAVLIALLIRQASQPLVKLKDLTKSISEGDYSARISVGTNDEVALLGSNFNRMSEAVKKNVTQLEDMIQRQRLFVGGLTHELKTPMTSMMIHTDTLLTADLTEEESRASLKHLYDQCRWLERLSQKLLKLTTVDEEIEIHPLNIEELFEDVVLSTQELLESRNTSLVVERDTDFLEADYDLMKSLLINLIDNASKASSDGQEIKLRIYNTPGRYYSDNLCRNIIEVSDKGTGIPEEEIPRVTDIFYMVDRSRSKKAGGSGLGLAIVKFITDAHRAQLVIESELKVGTTVKVKFPWMRQENND